MMKLEKLGESYKNYTWVTRYKTDSIYNLKLDQSNDEISFTWFKEALPETVDKSFDVALNADYVDKPESIGMFDRDVLVGIIETGVESWNKRLRITQLWVDESYHRQGIATQLMECARKRAKSLEYRALILETQSCNANAIAFYQNVGFRLTGFDLNAYSNDDVNAKEVRFEMTYILKEEA